MARHVEHLQCGFQLRQIDGVAFADSLMGEAEIFMLRRIDGHAAIGQQRFYTADMVVMVMRDQDAA